MNKLSKDSTLRQDSTLRRVLRQSVSEDEAGQRIDNYLMRKLKGVPKSHVYRILRSGEVRVNSGRIGPDYRLQAGDLLRIPPLRTAEPAAVRPMPKNAFTPVVLFEDEALLVIDKPSGLAVHGGSGLSFGVIEALRQARPDSKFLELVHRIDRDTSGVLMLAKKRAALVELHRQMQAGEIGKHYRVLIKGLWTERKRVVDLPLEKHVRASGERRVNVGTDGDQSITIFRLERRVGPYSLLDAELKTGRTHQIRVHLSHLGFPILGDDKYGDFALNKTLPKQGLKRMFLHSSRIVVRHPLSRERVIFEAPLPEELRSFIEITGKMKKHAAAV